ncbi:hypothetical protein GBA63_15945 [Rubrobacter tropicus]|uniref:Uncharacterized protein n=1 Tax=Rubrobacter tropicus TaxID=2653851 RepID=A0A6G8QBU1_9ACTN|nr:hypothetical protein [Rubrobacter tropicus]QIN83974.1 hypothetical protein GBA63_15945 [Rubrobacter tropicus]
MRKGTMGHRHAGYGRGGPRMHGRLYNSPVPPPFLALALLAAFALGRMSGMKRRFEGAWGPSARGCAGPPRGAMGHAPRRGEEPPVLL